MNHYTTAIFRIISEARLIAPVRGFRQGPEIHPYLIPEIPELDIRPVLTFPISDEWHLEPKALDSPLFTKFLTESEIHAAHQYLSTADTGRLLCLILPQHCRTIGPIAFDKSKRPWRDLTQWVISEELWDILNIERGQARSLVNATIQEYPDEAALESYFRKVAV